MYPSPSQYNDFLPDDRGLKKLQDARYGKFIFCSVLLHLVLVFCFITLNHAGRGYLHPGEKVVEVNLLSMDRKLPSVKSSSIRNSSVKDIEPSKHVLPPPTVMKEPGESAEILKEHTAIGKEIEFQEINTDSQSANPPEVLEKDNDIDSASILINNGLSISDVIPLNNEVYAQDSIINPEGDLDSRFSKDNDAVSQGQQYIDGNFYYVKDLITRNLIYPVLARRMKWQGTVEVSFVVLKTGNVKDIRIVTSSGHSLLDKNVVTAIQQVQPFPPPPVVAEFTMPIKYTLK